MKTLEKIILVQFFLHDAMEFEASGNTVFLGLNGTGKTAMLDAIQIVMLGANQKHLRFNALAEKDSTKVRTIRGYCLGMFAPEADKSIALRNRRDQANSFITLVFRDSKTGEAVTAGVGLTASIGEAEHEVEGLYVLPGVELSLSDHLEIENGEEVPCRWKTFESLARQRARAVGREPTFESRSEAYVRELLRAIGSSTAAINQREYLHVFSKSVGMKDIGAVSQFVGRFLVEAPKIDKQRAMQQVGIWKEFHRIIETLTQRVVDLSRFEREYEQIAGSARRVASLQALGATYRVDQAGDMEARAEDAATAAGDQAERDKTRKQQVDERIAAATVEQSGLLRSLSEDETQREADRLKEAIAAESKARDSQIDSLRELVVGLGKALEALGQLPPMAPYRERFLSAWNDLVSGLDRVQADGIDHMPALAGTADSIIEAAEETFEAARRKANAEVLAVQRELEEANGRIKSIESTGVDLVGDPARALALFAKHEIRATPICALVSVTDPAWQPAIEGFLRKNRESLIVMDGREDDAVGLLRELPPESRLYDARVVQPDHIQDQHWADPPSEMVGSMIKGKDRAAVAYVRQLLGGMRKATTNAELRKFPRALTADGMLSANGSTAALRLPSPGQLLLGRSAAPGDTTALKAALIAIQARLRDAQMTERRFNQAAASVAIVRRDGSVFDAAKAKVARCEELGSEIERLESRRSAIDLGHLASLQELLNQVVERLASHNAERDELVASIATNGKERERKLAEMQGHREDGRRASEEAAALQKDQDFDADLLDSLQKEIDGDVRLVNGGYPERLEKVAQKLVNARRRLQGQRDQAIQAFGRFVDDVARELIEERTDWRLALRWIKAHKEQLEKTELAHYRKEAETAKLRAEELFRADIAIRIKNAITDMRNNLRDLNNILLTCPSFSHGERYFFDFKPLDEYAALYRAITNAEDSFQLGDDDASKAIYELLELSKNSDEGRAATPLDDFRLMFKFDIDIKNEKGHVGWLSHRLGPGSTGEHRTPFYVVLGAALAHAYRLDAKGGGGAGLMLLDEAFYAMDSDNSLAAAQFLNGLGLQLLMTGPSTELAKLLAVSDRVIELTRFDENLFVQTIHVKEDAKALMVSDFPSVHPDLLDDLEAQLSAARSKHAPSSSVGA